MNTLHDAAYVCSTNKCNIGFYFFTPSAYIPFIGEENFSHSHTVARIIYSTIMKIAVNCILTSFLAVIFLWQGWSTLCKYRAGKTTLQVLFNNPCQAVVIIWLCLHRLVVSVIGVIWSL